MYWFVENELRRTFVISGAEKGAGNRSGTNQTPLGVHVVCEKYGDDLPEGAVLSSRKFTGEIATIYSGSESDGQDLITSRLLRLRGLEPGINQGEGIDSYERYIYIHGTSEEGRLGTPASHGCIRMYNSEIISLYPDIPLGTHVIIQQVSLQ